MYNIAYSDVKEQPVKIFDNSADNKMNLDGTGWKYTYQMDQKADSNNNTQNFEN